MDSMDRSDMLLERLVDHEAALGWLEWLPTLLTHAKAMLKP